MTSTEAQLGNARFRLAIHHELEQYRDGRARGLLKARGRLPISIPSRFPVGRIELWLQQPSMKRSGRDASGTCRILNAEPKKSPQPGRRRIPSASSNRSTKR